eukprot:TRINITY_DN6619_c0_g1_i7.p1 TRINITY_DN6619_c0_g1~~TRINITY_DN6619_c0_g1_i7.p1  ORF type:complete len:114 (+),score=6.64 TRINITY_DN6619_c0_g1_i7:220-561(+)
MQVVAPLITSKLHFQQALQQASCCNCFIMTMTSFFTSLYLEEILQFQDQLPLIDRQIFLVICFKYAYGFSRDVANKLIIYLKMFAVHLLLFFGIAANYLYGHLLAFLGYINYL